MPRMICSRMICRRASIDFWVGVEGLFAGKPCSHRCTTQVRQLCGSKACQRRGPVEHHQPTATVAFRRRASIDFWVGAEGLFAGKPCSYRCTTQVRQFCGSKAGPRRRPEEHHQPTATVAFRRRASIDFWVGAEGLFAGIDFGWELRALSRARLAPTGVRLRFVNSVGARLAREGALKNTISQQQLLRFAAVRALILGGS